MPSVSVGTSTTEIVSINYSRTWLAIKNSSSTADLHINFDQAATTDDFFLSPLESMVISPERTNKSAVNGIASAGTITVKFSVINQGT